VEDRSGSLSLPPFPLNRDDDIKPVSVAPFCSLNNESVTSRPPGLEVINSQEDNSPNWRLSPAEAEIVTTSGNNQRRRRRRRWGDGSRTPEAQLEAAAAAIGLLVAGTTEAAVEDQRLDSEDEEYRARAIHADNFLSEKTESGVQSSVFEAKVELATVLWIRFLKEKS
jgi:hypothetical protein